MSFAITVNGRSSIELDGGLGPWSEFFRQRLGSLDGVRIYAFSVWRFPDGVPFDHVNRRKVDEYIQVAGSQNGMTVEIRRIEDGGIPRQYTLGHRPVDAGATVAIDWDGHTVDVLLSEVFEFEEAAEIFLLYMDSVDAIVSKYAMRLLDL